HAPGCSWFDAEVTRRAFAGDPAGRNVVTDERGIALPRRTEAAAARRSQHEAITRREVHVGLAGRERLDETLGALDRERPRSARRAALRARRWMTAEPVAAHREAGIGEELDDGL